MQSPLNLVTLLTMVARSGRNPSEMRWLVTPAAWLTCCMIPFGKGRYLGDHMQEGKVVPTLLGIPMTIVRGSKFGDCGISLTLADDSETALVRLSVVATQGQ